LDRGRRFLPSARPSTRTSRIRAASLAPLGLCRQGTRFACTTREDCDKRESRSVAKARGLKCRGGSRSFTGRPVLAWSKPVPTVGRRRLTIGRGPLTVGRRVLIAGRLLLMAGRCLLTMRRRLLIMRRRRRMRGRDRLVARRRRRSVRNRPLTRRRRRLDEIGRFLALGRRVPVSRRRRLAMRRRRLMVRSHRHGPSRPSLATRNQCLTGNRRRPCRFLGSRRGIGPRAETAGPRPAGPRATATLTNAAAPKMLSSRCLRSSAI